ncbi:MAG: ferric reductase-like transmembrane domain-containing protein [Candidatus Latescibacterota bacterium]
MPDKKSGLVACAVVILVVPVAVVLTKAPADVVWLKVLQQIFGLWSFLLLVGQFILSSRLHTLEVGIGLDRLLHAHRYTGMAALVCLSSHAVFFLLHALLVEPDHPLDVARDWPVFVGMGMFLIVLVISITGLYWKRFRVRYETWKNIHYAAYALPPIVLIHIFLLGTHAKSSPTIRVLLIALGLGYVGIVLSRLRTYFRKRRRPFRVDQVIAQTYDTVSLRLSGGYPVAYQPGQFAFLTLIRHGRKAAPHPFTLSSSPDQDFLEFSIKASGDFTRTIAATREDDHAYIEGPYGNFSCLTDQRLTTIKELVVRPGGIADYQPAALQELVFLAGGIGITPFISMLRYLHGQKSTVPLLLFWANKTVQDVAFRDELRALCQQHPNWRVVHAFSGEKDGSVPGFGQVEYGYVTGELLHAYVPDVSGRGYFLCGPPIFRELLVQNLRSVGVADPNIHFEMFSW